MVKGLYTAYTGMINEQHRMDVLTNNLANATRISVSASVKFVGTQFIRGTAITELTLPGVEKLGDNAFVRADSLTVVHLPETLHEIISKPLTVNTVTVKAPANAFAERTKLTNKTKSFFILKTPIINKENTTFFYIDILNKNVSTRLG